MSEEKNILLAGIAGVLSWITGALGGWDGALAVLLGMMCADYLSGLALALVWHKSTKTVSGAASSAAGFKGLLRKMVMLLVVFLGAELDRVLGVDYVRTAVCLFYIANEGLSLLENTAAMGVPWPGFVKDMLDIMSRKSEEGGHGQRL